MDATSKALVMNSRKYHLAFLLLHWMQASSTGLSIHPNLPSGHRSPPNNKSQLTPQDESSPVIHNAKPTPLPSSTTPSRRRWLHDQILPSLALLTTTATLIDPSPSGAAQTIGKDPDCTDATCIGVWDGLLADCPHNGSSFPMGLGAGCVSSQDDTPGIFAEPWDYSEAPNDTLDWQKQMSLLIPAIQSVSSRRSDTIKSIAQTDRYLRVLFIDGKTAEESLGEFYFTPNDTTVQFRIGSVSSSSPIASLKNLQRAELFRKQLGYTKLTVLRNRKRALFFVESSLDSFGPGSAALGPPAEMTTGELEGRQDVDPRLKIDFVESFPKR